MMRVPLTRLANSATRTVLLAPCLLICLACATPFPLENLEFGMTTEAVREEFGAPEATEADFRGDGKSCWTYLHWEQDWSGFARKAVLLDFEEGKLVFWETFDAIEFGSKCSIPMFAEKSPRAFLSLAGKLHR